MVFSGYSHGYMQGHARTYGDIEGSFSRAAQSPVSWSWGYQPNSDLAANSYQVLLPSQTNQTVSQPNDSQTTTNQPNNSQSAKQHASTETNGK